MVVFSGVRYRPIAWAEARDDSTDPEIIVLHLSAVEARSLYGDFSTTKDACSTLHVARDGYTEQYIDTSRLSAAEYQGSSRAISIETQGADADGLWTPEQCEKISDLIAQAHRAHPAIELRLMDSSATSEEGVGWHRLGIDGNFPALPSILAGRIQRGGGELWSTSFGKLCPGPNRIKQIPGILARAVQILEGDTMADLTPDNLHQIAAAVWDYGIAQDGASGVGNQPAWLRFSWMHHDTALLAARTTMSPLEMLEARFKTGRRVTVDGVEVDEEVRLVDALKAVYFYGDLAHAEVPRPRDGQRFLDTADGQTLRDDIAGVATPVVDVEALAAQVAALIGPAQVQQFVDALLGLEVTSITSTVLSEGV